MFDWWRRRAGAKTAPTTVLDPNDVAPALGKWVFMDLPLEQKGRFLGYVYFDPEAGLSAKGGPEADPQLDTLPRLTVRLPIGKPLQPLSDEETRVRGLPSTPAWLHHYGPQPRTDAPWRVEPALKGRFHPSYPDDLEVLVHDGEPRRTQKPAEVCWVRVVDAEPGPIRRYIYLKDATPLSQADFARRYEGEDVVYVATLLNQPHQLLSVHQGDVVRFLAHVGGKHPLMVTPQYLKERRRWRVLPCNKCGFCEGFDPPSEMARARFPEMEPDGEMKSFTSFCPFCDGMQMFSANDDRSD
jgi:hypothetical protein